MIFSRRKSVVIYPVHLQPETTVYIPTQIVYPPGVYSSRGTDVCVLYILYYFKEETMDDEILTHRRVVVVVVVWTYENRPRWGINNNTNENDKIKIGRPPVVVVGIVAVGVAAAVVAVVRNAGSWELKWLGGTAAAAAMLDWWIILLCRRASIVRASGPRGEIVFFRQPTDQQ